MARSRVYWVLLYWQLEQHSTVDIMDHRVHILGLSLGFQQLGSLLSASPWIPRLYRNYFANVETSEARSATFFDLKFAKTYLGVDSNISVAPVRVQRAMRHTSRQDHDISSCNVNFNAIEVIVFFGPTKYYS